MLEQLENRIAQWVSPGPRIRVGPCAVELLMSGHELEWDGALQGTARIRAAAGCRVAAVNVCLEEWSVLPRDLGEVGSELTAISAGVPWFLIRPRNISRERLFEHCQYLLGCDFPLEVGETWERQFALPGPWARPFTGKWRVRLDVTLAGIGKGEAYERLRLLPAASFRQCTSALADVTGLRVAHWELRTAFEDSVGRPLPHVDASLLDPLQDPERHASRRLEPERVAGVRVFLNPLGDPERLAREWASPILWRDVAALLSRKRARLEMMQFAGRVHGTVAFGLGGHRGRPFDCPMDDPYEARRQFQAILRSRLVVALSHYGMMPRQRIGTPASSSSR